MKYIFTIFIIITFTFGNKCEYPFKFKFNNELFYPVMSTSVNNLEHSFKELLLQNSKDEYITLFKELPAIFTFKNKKDNFKKIILNKNLVYYTFKKEIQTKSLLLKEYSSLGNDVLLFIFNKENNNFLGTLGLVRIDQTTKNNIIKSLVLHKRICTEKEYWNLYIKTKQPEYNKKLKLLYSLFFLNTVSVESAENIKKEIIKVLNIKRNIIESAIKDLDINNKDTL